MSEIAVPKQIEALSVAETLRIMDVASEIRRQQNLVEAQFNEDQLKEKLRENLIAASQVTGEELTNEQIERAISWYYDHLHKYKSPKPSVSIFFAHLYIRRWGIFALCFFLGFLSLAGWILYLVIGFLSS